MNRKIQNTFFSMLLIFFLATLSQAQQVNSSSEQTISPAKTILIKEYFEVTGGRESINKSLDAVFANLNSTLPMIIAANIEEDINLTAAQKADLQKSMPETIARMGKKLQDGLNQELDFAKVVEEVNYPLLDKFFTEAELNDLIAFYKSPTGQKAISLQPQIYTEATTRLNAILIPVMQKAMKKAAEDEIAERVNKTKQGK
ncbi:MAG: DUF2059 domain-containing protein [Pyrinomonadaceae bacterium]|nr:DUF2059 domain-containing protein [Pyrinomonadaceae bacterium]